MFNLSGSETVFLLLLALIILGPEKLPEALRRFGKAYGDFKRMATGFQSEMRTALDEPMREMRETADAVKKAAQLEGLDEFVSDAKRSFRFQTEPTKPVNATGDAPTTPADGADTEPTPVANDPDTPMSAPAGDAPRADAGLSVLDGDIIPTAPPSVERRSNTAPGPRFASAAPRPTHRRAVSEPADSTDEPVSVDAEPAAEPTPE